MKQADVCIIGGGIAGLSLGAQLSAHGAVTVIEGESAPGYHASGRSVAYAHFGLGERVVRTLTAMSMADFTKAPEAGEAEVARIHPALHIARADQKGVLDELEQVHRDFERDFARIDGEAARAMVPVLKSGPDHVYEALVDRAALKLDTDAMLQNALRVLRRGGGQLIGDTRIDRIERADGQWHVHAGDRRFAAKVLINAAGAWADDVARMAGTAPVGIEPRRRTVIAFAAPEEHATRSWPFVKTVGEGFYMLPEGAGQLLASPMDQTPCDPCDAAPEELDIATVAHRIEEATTLRIARIAHSWAGLRSFARDELPVVGIAKDAPGFFWFAGQGGYGFQTAPALARLGATLVLGQEWPREAAERGLTPALLAPERFAD
ncbi:NAD(P)/FAD-dependent oxidoreductase [Erythrobacter sp.]|jgi:D-arginine dehydrogenase|uniref:NAD(P)/FAD-dependent oxidoreductase n=1 Tax=Erythrobacter sp. TaxID=1042 RepID=UPI002EB42916|nr:FAD-binding oxidoreductase [Erythrobacter sp.]